MEPCSLPWRVRLARRRPSRPEVMAAALAVVAAMPAIEASWGWPEALTPTRAWH